MRLSRPAIQRPLDRERKRRTFYGLNSTEPAGSQGWPPLGARVVYGVRMRWEDERYVRVYTRDTTDWLALSFDAQALLLMLLRKVDRAGLLPLGRHGKRGVAIAIGHPREWARLEPALEELLADGCVRVLEDRQALFIPNFLAAQEAKASDKARQQKAREAARALAAGVTPRDGADTTRDQASHGVTNSHERSHGVTSGHAASRGVTPSRAVPSRAEPYSDPLAGKLPAPAGQPATVTGVGSPATPVDPPEEPEEASEEDVHVLEAPLAPAAALSPRSNPPAAGVPPSGAAASPAAAARPQLTLTAEPPPLPPKTSRPAQIARKTTEPAGPRPEELQALWNELAPPKGLQRWESMSSARKAAAKLHLAACPDLGRWRRFLEVRLADRWNLGENSSGWKADVDWLLRAKTRDQVLDFHPAPAAPPGPPAAPGKPPGKWIVIPTPKKGEVQS